MSEALLLSLDNQRIDLPGRTKKSIHVSLSLSKGQVCLVRGSNGAGKSTFLKWLYNSEYFDHKSLAYLPQGADEDFILPCQLIEAAGFISANPADISDSLLPASLWTRPWNKASLGERQRALLAGVFNKSSSVYLMDEPTSALDLGAELKFWDLVKEHVNQGASFIIVYHGNSTELPKHKEVLL